MEEQEPLSIINQYLIPALDVVGKGFEKGTIFLPQLLMSADAAKIAFAVLKDELAAEEKDKRKRIRSFWPQSRETSMILARIS